MQDNIAHDLLADAIEHRAWVGRELDLDPRNPTLLADWFRTQDFIDDLVEGRIPQD